MRHRTNINSFSRQSAWRSVSSVVGDGTELLDQSADMGSPDIVRSHTPDDQHAELVRVK